MQQIIYQAGEAISPRISMATGLLQSGLSRQKAEMVVRFIEFWCQNNCVYSWRIRETRDEITIAFDDYRDAVLFRISEFDSYFHHGVITTEPEPTN